MLREDFPDTLIHVPQIVKRFWFHPFGALWTKDFKVLIQFSIQQLRAL